MYHGIVAGDLNGDLSLDVAVIKGSTLIVYPSADVSFGSVVVASDAIDVCFSPDASGPGAGVGVLTLEQPGKPVVVLDLPLIQRLEATLHALPKDLRGLVLASAGDRAFVAGADLNAIQALDDDQLHQYLAYASGVFAMLSQLPFPTATAIQGAALGGGLGFAGVLLIGWLTTLWALTKRLPDTNIAMGDIVNADGDIGFEGSYFACRLRCVFDRFDRSCVAFTYDKSVVPKEQEPQMRRCYPKYAAVFYWNPSKSGTEPTDSEIMPSLFKAPPVPKESPYLTRWYRGLAGEPVDVSDMVSAFDNLTVISDEKSGRQQWSLRGAECQQACIDLGGKCKGFSYTSIASRCELFKSVKGVLRDQSNGRPVYMPVTISGCDDPKAAIDPETKQSECPEKSSWKQSAPVRSPTPAEPKK